MNAKTLTLNLRSRRNFAEMFSAIGKQKGIGWSITSAVKRRWRLRPQGVHHGRLVTVQCITRRVLFAEVDA